MALGDISVKPMKILWNGTDLGSTQGGVEISMETSMVDITTDQGGANILDSHQNGLTVSITVEILELNTANYNAMIASTIGDSVTPTEGGTYTALGVSRNFTSMLSKCQLLELRPVGETDSTNSWSFWKACPAPSSLTFASDSASTMSVEFKIFPDSSKSDEAQIGVLGDNTLTYTA